MVEVTTIPEFIAALFHQNSGRLIATLIGKFNDFTLAEDALQDAILLALERWPLTGIPQNPSAWLLVTAQHKGIDRLRRSYALQQKYALLHDTDQYEVICPINDDFDDERLKLIFTCCHPALRLDAQVALTLHTLGGLTTSEIAHAFLVTETTMAQRLVRAKKKIREAGIPYAVPPPTQRAPRITAVLAVIYLIFNAGYTAESGSQLIRTDLCGEAIRLARALVMLLRQESAEKVDPEVLGLLSLLLLHDSRRHARVDSNGALVPLEQQDRSLWLQASIVEGIALLDEAMMVDQPGQYQVQAAISAVHAQAVVAEATDWLQIALLYGKLLGYNNSAVVCLNWAVAVAMASTPQRGIELLHELAAHRDMLDYYLFHAALADLYRRDGQWDDAALAYQQAIARAHNGAELAFLHSRLHDVQTHLP